MSATLGFLLGLAVMRMWRLSTPSVDHAAARDGALTEAAQIAYDYAPLTCDLCGCENDEAAADSVRLGIGDAISVRIGRP